MRISLLRTAAAVCTLCLALVAQAPPGYYATVDTSTAARLRSTLHAVIDDHQRLPYTASSLDTWDVLESAQVDPNAPTRILDVYRNESFRTVTDRVSGYNREHVWPKSYGFPNDGSDNYPYTDCHALWLCDASYNSSRSNLPFDACSSGCAEYPTLPNNGMGGGSGTHPGQSNWRSGSAGAFGTWEVWAGRKGDLARAIFYMDVRYEGGTHGGTGVNEPDLIVTDDRSLIANGQSTSNRSVAYMGVLSTLLAWHRADPPDAFELRRNDVVFGAQGNRNPFVDHPEWIDYLFGGAVPGSFTTYGTGCAASTGVVPGISYSGTLAIGQNLTMLCSGAPSFQPALLNFDITASSLPLSPFGLSSCTLLARPGLVVGASTNLFGTAAAAMAVPNDLQMVGFQLFSQWVVLDPAGAGAATTQGAELRFGRS